MSDATEKKPADAKAGEKKAKKGPAADVLKPKKNKVAWTLERCKKTARRFASEADWSAGAPAAYKSAVAHGWVAQCLPQGAGKSRKTA